MLIHSTENAHPVVLALLRAYGFPTGGPDLALDPVMDLAIDGRDEMFRHNLYDRHGSRELALAAYFHSGYTAYRTLRGILRACFPEARWPTLRLLDFASGYGRLTRFLLQDFPAERLAIAEIDPDAVAFQRQRFGVRGIVSTPSPEALPLDPTENPATDRFDAIFVGSLFSHLPRQSFEGWLRRLHGLLAPGGVLIFSVHDAAAMLPGRTLPDDGFYFEAQSESDFLELTAYGSTWVSEDFVARSLAGLPGGAVAYHRIPYGLWHWQDLYVVGAGRALPSMEIGRGIQGYVDVLPVGRSAALRLWGWAVDHDRHRAVDEVVITLDGVPCARLQPRESRPDVRAFLGDEAFLHSGWQWTLDPPPRPDALLLITAEGRDGPVVLHAGSLESSVLATLRQQDQRTLNRVRDIAERRRLALATTRAEFRGLRARTDALEQRFAERGYEGYILEQRIAAMEASWFWKLRNLWFRLKGWGTAASSGQ
jgi:SAM-dependent methyltransferase